MKTGIWQLAFCVLRFALLRLETKGETEGESGVGMGRGWTRDVVGRRWRWFGEINVEAEKVEGGNVKGGGWIVNENIR